MWHLAVWALTAVCAAVLAVLLALGVWQVQRLVWKQGLIDLAARAETLPPVPLSQAFAEGNPEFRRVRRVIAPHADDLADRQLRVGTIRKAVAVSTGTHERPL